MVHLHNAYPSCMVSDFISFLLSFAGTIMAVLSYHHVFPSIFGENSKKSKNFLSFM